MIVVVIVFALLYVFAEFGPVSNLITVPQDYATAGFADQTPWALLVLGVVVPVVLYIAALLLGRGRPPFARTLLLLVGLTASFALAFSIVALDLAF